MIDLREPPPAAYELILRKMEPGAEPAFLLTGIPEERVNALASFLAKHMETFRVVAAAKKSFSSMMEALEALNPPRPRRRRRRR